MKVTDGMLARMKSDPQYREAIESKLAKEMISRMVGTAVAHGIIDPKGKTPFALEVELIEKFFPLGEKPLRFTIDHTRMLMTLARGFENDGRPWLATVFYATWVEHTLNYLVSVGVLRRGMKDSDVAQVIRDTPLSGKLSWLMPLLGFKSVSTRHAGRLRELADLRNQFVHYKWSYKELERDSDRQVTKVLPDVRKSLRYLAHYATRETMRGASGLVRSIARRDSSKMTPAEAVALLSASSKVRRAKRAT